MFFRNLLMLMLIGAASTLVGAGAAEAESDSVRVARLFMWASSGSVRFRDMVEPAKDSILAMGETGARWLAYKLPATDARERHTLADIFEKLGAVATPYVAAYLDSSGEYMPKNAARCLGRIGDSAAVPSLLPQLGHTHYSVRSEVATALGRIKDARAVDALLARLDGDTDGDVRKSCAVALGAIGDARAATALIAKLNDSFFGVRQSAQKSLAQLDPPPVSELIEAVETSYGLPQYGAIVALGGIDDKRSRKVLAKLLSSDDPALRGFAVEGLTPYADKGIVKRIAKLRHSEIDPFVLAQIARFDAEQ